MKPTLHRILLLFFMCLLGQMVKAQDQYVDFYNIFPTDSVTSYVPDYNNQLFIYKNPSNGTLKKESVNGQFKITYLPYATFLGLDTFQVVYFVPGANNNLSKKSKQVIIRVSPFILHDDVFAVYNDDTLQLNVLANDELAGNPVKITFLASPTSTDLSLNTDSSAIQYKGSGQPRIEFLSYRACNNAGDCETGNFKLLVKSHNNNKNLFFFKFMRRDHKLIFSHPYDSMFVSLNSHHGTTSLDGYEITYTPDSAYVGLDTFKLSFTNGNAEHEFVINVTDEPAPNVLVEDDYFYTLTNHAVKTDLLRNDFTRDLVVSIFDEPVHGTLSRNSNGIYTYTPETNYTGVDVFTYQACEPNSNVCEQGQVYISIGNFEPDYKVYLSTAKNTYINIDYPFPASGYKLKITNYPDHGYVSVKDRQTSMQYVPAQNYVGQDSMNIEYCLISDPSVCYSVKIYIEIYDLVGTCSKNCLWPGDHNNDGRVDMRDLTFMAPFVGSGGTLRDASLNPIWIGQNSDDWAIKSNNVNLKYADSDGNSVISAADTSWLSHYYRKSHGIPVNRGFNSSDLPFKLKSDKSFYYPGDTILIDFSIGSDSWNIRNLSGFTASFSFSDAFNDSNLTGQLLDQSWVKEGSNSLELVKKPFTRILDFGFARIGDSGVPGHGRVGTIKSIIDESLQGFRREDGILYATIDINSASITTSDGRELTYPSTTILIPVKLKNHNENTVANAIIVYPNPVRNILHVSSTNEEDISSIIIYSISGQLIQQIDKINSNNFDINFGNYLPGLYLVKSFSKTGVSISKVEKF
ncbi:MAG TPA: Ig-like domain-containing protein [Saprospiraceae bacterium]|nr:Ig-like domain-containing protein [Saprospiraceae bacterium]HQW56171.1 Ig-like domain-containing protein [Saprospiraceae bacterium]